MLVSNVKTRELYVIYNKIHELYVFKDSEY